MRSSALAGFIASAVLVSGSAGFASTFLVGPYLGDHVRHQSPRAALMSSAAPMDPLAVIQTSAATKTALDGEPIESQPAHRLRPVENTTTPATTATPTTAAPSATIATASTDMPGPISEDAFTHTSSPGAMPTASGGPLIATEATSAMVAAKLEDGEPVLTLRIAPVLTPAATALETTDPDSAVEPTVMSAPPQEQALAASTVTAAPPAVEPVAPPPAEPVVRPRTKPPALQAREPAAEPVRRAKPRATPARVTTTAAPARATREDEAPAAAPEPDPLNAPYMPSTSPTINNEGPSTAPATGAPASMAPPPSSGGPTPLVMPQ